MHSILYRVTTLSHVELVGIHAFLNFFDDEEYIVLCFCHLNDTPLQTVHVLS